jgi:hypothetical protein
LKAKSPKNLLIFCGSDIRYKANYAIFAYFQYVYNCSGKFQKPPLKTVDGVDYTK